MKFIHGLLTFAAVIICRAISWVLIMTWQIPVHYTELQTEDKLKSTCYDRAIFRLCSRDTHTFFHDIVSRVDTPVIPIPEVYSTNGEKKIIKDRPKSWWSSEERSASLELSYITAVVDSKLVLFSNPEGVAIKHSPSPHSTPRSDETKSDGNRERSRARDWDTMPEVIKKSKGRFHLHGGKNLYTDMDLANNLERHRALTRRTRRGFSGWNRHSAASTTGTTSAISSSKNISDDGQMIDMQNQSQLPLKGIKKLPRDSTQIHYNDFIPSKISPKLPFSSVSSDSTSEDAIVQVTKVKDFNQSKNDNEDTMIWEINPSLA